MVKIDLTVNKENLQHNIRKAKENKILIPTIDQMIHPEHAPEKVKEGLSKEDQQLLKDMNAKIQAIESYQKVSTETRAEVVLNRDTAGAENERLPPDSLLTFRDAWLDLIYNTYTQGLLIRLQDSLAIAVEKEYKRRFLWWKWGTKGYRVKAVSFCPYTTIRYNTYIKKKR